MPVVKNIPLELEVAVVLSRVGFNKRSKVRPKIKAAIFELLRYVEEEHLLKTGIVYEIYPASEIRTRQLFSGNNTEGDNTPFDSLLTEAEEFAVAVGTIGPDLEEQVTEYNKQGDNLQAVLLDGMGSAAVDKLSQEACQLIADENLPRGLQVSSPINPGIPVLPITKQEEMFAMVPATEIGVSLTSSGIMVPRKSTSMVIGIGRRMKTWTQAEICDRCNLGKTCPYRIWA